MCGVAGVVCYDKVSYLLYEVLTILQHRGQDAAGIATCHNKHFFLRKSVGLVRDVFLPKHMSRLKGNIGIGHVRYPTSGTINTMEAQPFYVNAPFGIMLAHNGNLTNDRELRDFLFHTEKRHLNTGSDSEVLVNILAHELYKQPMNSKLEVESIFLAVTGLFQKCKGGYAAVAIINGHGLLALRDPYGIRPLVLGKKNTNKGAEYMVASESVALNSFNFEFVRDVAPGEAIFISEDHKLYSKQCMANAKLTPCLFEYIYLSRPDSILDKVSVYNARLQMGKKLAKKIKKEWPDIKFDAIIPIPDSGRATAIELAEDLNVPYREGLVKNNYIGRTFIMPDQQKRAQSVRRKLNAIDNEFEGKIVLLVDDSIVRGTTSKQIIELVRESGAKKVYICSAAPPVKYPNVYGIDMPNFNDLIAYQKDVEQIRISLGADGLIYQDLDQLIDIIKELNPEIENVEASVFGGNYITGDINDAYLYNLSQKRSGNIKNDNDPMLEII